MVVLLAGCSERARKLTFMVIQVEDLEKIAPQLLLDL